MLDCFLSIFSNVQRAEKMDKRLAMRTFRKLEEAKRRAEGVPCEPAEGTPGNVQIVVRTTDGTRISRRFLVDSTRVEHLYDWVDTVARPPDAQVMRNLGGGSTQWLRGSWLRVEG